LGDEAGPRCGRNAAVIDWYQREIIATGKQPLAVLFLAFVVSFLFIRLSVRMIRAGVKWWPGNVSSGGVHVHHAVFGTVFMLIAGVGGFSVIGGRTPWAEIFAGLFGCGAALVLDEFALILRLRDVYWTEQGRTSVDAVFLATAVLGLLLLGVAPFGVNDVAVRSAQSAAWGYVWAVVSNGALVVLTLFKGKIWTGLLGILLPVLALIGALRLARPESPWARWRYQVGGRKEARARRRDERLRTRWVRAGQRLQDAVAGRPT
jgi:hypothetical protein